MLRAAYFAQELLSTFGTSIGEVALQPTTGGVFQVHLTYVPVSEHASKDEAQDADASAAPKEVLLWDRKTEGGFPETKVLKQLVRDCIQPDKDLGHSDKHGKIKKADDGTANGQVNRKTDDGLGEPACA